jgi:single-strand DNA-binding protein
MLMSAGHLTVVDEHVNQVSLRGRLSAAAEQRGLPSGDQVVTFRLVVDRGPSNGRSSGRVTKDAIACVAWRADLRRRLLRLDEGAIIEVEGALRRRFWRSPQGVGSRYEVEVDRMRRAPVSRPT